MFAASQFALLSGLTRTVALTGWDTNWSSATITGAGNVNTTAGNYAKTSTTHTGSGKFWLEIRKNTTAEFALGFVNTARAAGALPGANDGNVGFFFAGTNGVGYVAGGGSSSGGRPSWVNGDVIGIGLDFNAGQAYQNTNGGALSTAGMSGLIPANGGVISFAVANITGLACTLNTGFNPSAYPLPIGWEWWG